MTTVVPENETGRLAALAMYRILDTPPEFAYDALKELAAEIRGWASWIPLPQPPPARGGGELGGAAKETTR